MLIVSRLPTEQAWSNIPVHKINHKFNGMSCHCTITNINYSLVPLYVVKYIKYSNCTIHMHLTRDSGKFNQKIHLCGHNYYNNYAILCKVFHIICVLLCIGHMIPHVALPCMSSLKFVCVGLFCIFRDDCFSSI